MRRGPRRLGITKIWLGAGTASSSGRNIASLAGQRGWLTVERLPAYAPDLNPVEPLWSNLKTRDLANHCTPDLDALGRPLRAGLGRIHRHTTLALNSLHHAGLTP